jgi:hypothetical protein
LWSALVVKFKSEADDDLVGYTMHMQRYKITLVDGAFHIEGFPDAVKVVSTSALSPHLTRQLADLVLHRNDLSFSKQCVEQLRNFDNPPLICEALWRSAIVYYCKCFDQSGKIRGPLTIKYLPAGNARLCHQYFLDLRNKHLVHDENSYAQTSVGAVIAPSGRDCKVEEVVCTQIIGVILTSENLNNLTALIDEVLGKVESRFDQLVAKIKKELEAESYETLLSQPDMTPYQAPTVAEVSNRRQI